MKVNQLIEKALRENVKYKGISVRDSDKALILWVWWQLGFQLTHEQMDKFMNLPSTETIRRLRQKLQEKGKYGGSKAVLDERRWKSLVASQNMPTASLNRSEDILKQRSLL